MSGKQGTPGGQGGLQQPPQPANEPPPPPGADGAAGVAPSGGPDAPGPTQHVPMREPAAPVAQPPAPEPPPAQSPVPQSPPQPVYDPPPPPGPDGAAGVAPSGGPDAPGPTQHVPVQEPAVPVAPPPAPEPPPPAPEPPPAQSPVPQSPLQPVYDPPPPPGADGAAGVAPSGVPDAPGPTQHVPVQEPAVPVAQPPAPEPPPAQPPVAQSPPPSLRAARSEEYYDVKATVFNALVDTIDLTQLARLDAEAAREEIRDIVSEIVAIKHVVMSIAEQEELLEDICNDVLGYGPLEPLLARDDIADIMVNGAGTTYIEVDGMIEPAAVRFADNGQLMNICQRIVSQVGRRVDESSPICDARLPDGSRVNVIAPPLALDGPTLTIRKFKKDRLTLDQLLQYGSTSQEGRTILSIIGRVRCNTIVSGGTGSGKTTLLNCLTGEIDQEERVITCEDSAELQLQKPHVVRLETRPPNLEGEGEVTMRDLVRNCLRMRPDRIIVGEVRGPEAFDLLQAMNTGHDGSMGTLHSNSPRECLSRLESMILMGGYNLPSKTIREMIVASVDVIIQVSRLRDGSRKITHVTEVVGLEGDVITLQDVYIYELLGEDSDGRINGRHRTTGIARPRFWDRAQYFKEEARLAEALAAGEVADDTGRPLGESFG